MLRTLIDGQGRVISREDLCSQLAGSGKPQASDESLRFYILRLRKKIEPDDPKLPRRIQSVIGVGYRFNMTPSSEDRHEEVYQLGSGRKYYPERNRIEVYGEEISFTRTENILLWLLVENLGKVVSKEALIDEAWSKDTDSNVESLVKKYIHRIRRKIRDSKDEYGKYRLIRSIHGVGYKLNDEDRPEIPTSSTIFEA